MRIILLFSSLFLLGACTMDTNSGSPAPADIVQSQISSEKYSPQLQKTIPSPTYGTGKHDITIYADFQCPACINFSQGIGTLFESYADAGLITITYKQFPLTSIHKNAYRDALASLCSAEQSKFVFAKKALYALEAQKKGSTVSDSERISALSAVGIEPGALTQCLKENRYAQQIDNEVIAGDKAGVSGTPTILFNGTRLDYGVIFADPQKGKAFLDRIFTE